jgi:hypothetical protein
MDGQQMGAHLAFIYDGTVHQKQLTAPYLTTYLVQALSALGYTKTMDPIKKFSFMIIKVPSKSSSGSKNVSFLATLSVYKAVLLLVLCSFVTLNVKGEENRRPSFLSKLTKRM